MEMCLRVKQKISCKACGYSILDGAKFTDLEGDQMRIPHMVISKYQPMKKFRRSKLTIARLKLRMYLRQRLDDSIFVITRLFPLVIILVVSFVYYSLYFLF